MSCPQIWHIEKEKDREKRESRRQTSETKQKKGDGDLEREIKDKGDIICRKNNMKILQRR